MVDSRHGTAGKRRNFTSSSHHDHDDSHGKKSSSDGAATSSSAAATRATSSSSGGGGLDTFLQRLDDIDLTKKDHHPHKHNSNNNNSNINDMNDSPINDITNFTYTKNNTTLNQNNNNNNYNPTHNTTNKKSPQQQQQLTSKSSPQTILKKLFLLLTTLLFLYLLHDTLTSPPSERLLSTTRLHSFLLWVKSHPFTGAAAFIFVYGMCVALLLPGTPLTLGGGYVYKVSYGWVGGVCMGTFTSMAGSLFGSCFCFILGRYVMRERVRRWGRRYPLFDAIDIAVSDNGFKIMCLLYLTPILPLGPVSYMCGTTSMPLIKFASAKIAALPLMLLYVLIGASTDTFMGGGDASTESGGSSGGKGEGNAKLGMDDATHRKMVLFGLCLSIVSMSAVSHFVKKELYKIFDKQKKDKGEEEEDGYRKDGSEHVELISRTDNLQRRPRGVHDEENG